MPEAATDPQTHAEANDVAADVAAALDKLEAEENESGGDVSDETITPTESQDDAAATDQASTDQAADAAGETSDAVREGQEAPRETEVATDQAAADEAVAYPEHWDQQYKAEFEAMPANMQSFLLERHKSMEADYTKKNMETADLRREYEPVDTMLRAFTPMMQAQGIGPGELIRRWAQAESYLNSQPEQAIKTLAQHYGVDLAAIAYDSPAQHQGTPQQGEGYQDPQVQTLQTQVNNLTTAQHLQTINAFADEVGTDGTKLHPHFDEVAQVIAQDLRAAQALGLQPSLQELYDQACWKTPSVRDKLLAQQQQTTLQQQEQVNTEAAEKARQAAAKAKAASKSISGDAGSAAEPKPSYSSVEEAVAAAYDKSTH